MKSTFTNHIESFGLLYFLPVLFLVAGFYFQPNLGGRGLFLPFNITCWLATSICISSAILVVATNNRFKLPKNYLYILAAPLVIIFSGFLAGSSQPITWLFRQLYIVGGILFLFSLFQFNSNEKKINQILMLICLSAYLHSFIGIFQIYIPETISEILPTNQGKTPSGIFQQINVQVTYLVTGIALTLYLLSRPIARSIKPLSSAFFFIGTSSCAYIIIYSGSRVGLLTLILSLALLLFLRRHQLLRVKRHTVTIVAAICLGTILASQSPGLDNTIKKTQDLSGGSSTSARLSMYTIAWELIKQKPISGHGIGSYLRVWNRQTGDFHARNPNAIIPPYVTHPHNELVFWLIEGGIIGISGILLAITSVIISLAKCGLQRGGSYAALLLPISLHAQVELPFYISSLHWFLWLFLIFLALRHQPRLYKLHISRAAALLLKSTSIFFLVGSIYFFVHSERSQTDILNFVQNKSTGQPYLRNALTNLYFKPYAEELAMRAYLYRSINANDRNGIKNYVKWARKELTLSPRLKLFEDLIAAYIATNDESRKCEIIRMGGFMYPANTQLHQLAKGCANM